MLLQMRRARSETDARSRLHDLRQRGASWRDGAQGMREQPGGTGVQFLLVVSCDSDKTNRAWLAESRCMRVGRSEAGDELFSIAN